MNVLGIISLLASSFYGVQGQATQVFCPTTYLDRYCALKDQISVYECLLKQDGSERGFEIFTNCFKSVSELVKAKTLDEQVDEVCNLNADEYAAISQCIQNGVELDKKRGGRYYKMGGNCLFETEIKEKQICGLRYYFPYVGRLKL